MPILISDRQKHFNGNARIQTADVVATAHIVPIGMDFEASAKSPDLLDPAIIPASKQPYSV